MDSLTLEKENFEINYSYVSNRQSCLELHVISHKQDNIYSVNPLLQMKHRAKTLFTSVPRIIFG